MSSVKETSNDAAASDGAVTGVLEKSEGRKAESSAGSSGVNVGDEQLQSSTASPQSPQAVTSTTFQSHPDTGHYPPYQQQTNQAPNSPSNNASLGSGRYGGMPSLLALQSGSNGFSRQQYNNNVPPLSPAVRDISNGEINLPPASPLFPGTVPLYSASSEQLDSTAMNGGSMFASTTSPSFQYLSGPPPSPVISYGYPPSIPNSPELRNSWSDRNLTQQHLYNSAPTSSPHLHGVPVQYQGNIPQTRRTGSFDGSEMLPPTAAVDDNSSAMFSTGGNLFSQSWGAPLPDIYPSPSSLQQHMHQQISSPPRVGGMHAREQHLGLGPPPHPAPHGHGSSYFPAATPGPPIQTTQNNKGPDGANLFIFHIPNHFTNLDMWHLFCHYGNLLSVRIMVEKDTGRSRGFGFVSYDSPDAAAMAIKELNGFVIGNKRLKVQHKQIRPSDNNSGQQNEVVAVPQPSNWTSNDTAERRVVMANISDARPPSIPDVEGNHLSSDHVGSTLVNLDSIRDALPDVQ